MRIFSIAPAIIMTLLLGTTPPAVAATSSELVDDSVAHSIAAVANAPRTSESFAGFVQLQNQPPLRDVPYPSLFASDSWYPTAAPENFDAPALVSIVPDTGLRVERWLIQSPAMQRVVEVQIMRAPDATKPAPFLFALDGASAPSRNGWLRKGNIEQALGNEQVTVVMPVQASGSLYLDWVEEDEKIRRPMWETFITTELPQVLEDPAHGLNFNGRRAILGLSMGAAGAVRLANAHPDYFHAVAGLSGCYSNSTEMGLWMNRTIIQSVGANPDKLFGTTDSTRLDPVRSPMGLKNMPVYLYSADGYVTDNDIINSRNRPRYELAGGVLLEYATKVCTEELDTAMKSAGMNHQQVVLQHGGVHDWPYYRQQLAPAWEHLKSALY